ncbi:hypothetical protein GGX14DRAFT_522261 [Mycena pura]|uniref:Uncharacterized protein n=1 Tax=Mycena pura TaxID=153505 RepID=A0AAD6VAE9_9AGAR|nr:hypothetical protein GGX14DRAFT_522261 [Mycena pura]
MWGESRFTALTFALALTSVVAQVTLDPTKCFTLSTNGTQYLDSTNSVMEIQSHPDRAALEAGTDKGVRFHFPLGEGGWVAHDEHFVGTTIPPSDWKTELSLGSTSELATIHLTSSGTKAYLNSGPRHYVSSSAGVSSTEFDWDILEINCLLS